MPTTRRRRVLLRPPAATDRDAFVAAMSASRDLHRPWVSPPTTAAAFDRWLERYERDERYEPMLAVRRDDGAIVGFLNLAEIIRGSLQSAFLGYAVVAEHAGRGYMTEAMGLVLGHAFDRLRLHRVEANIQPANMASIGLARRCGFVREGFSERYLKINGRWCDHERWALRAEQWRARGRPI